MRRLLEALTFNDAPRQIDREAGVIRSVKLLGEVSANPAPHNHVYPRSTRQAALGHFRDARVCVNHPARGKGGDTRPYEDGIGVIKDPREEGDGVYGDFHFNPQHELASQILWDAENAPQHLGFSINGDGDKRRDGDRTVVEAITGIASIDLVSHPATTSGLFEGRRMSTTEKRMKVRELIEATKDRRPGFSRALREMADSGIMTDDSMMEQPDSMDAPADLSADADHEATFIQGVKDAIGQVLDDESMDWDERIKQVMAYLKTAKKHTAEDGGESGGEPVEEEYEPDDDEKKKGPPMEEGKKGKKPAGSELRESALTRLAAKGAKLTPTLLLAVKGCQSDADVAALVESQQAEPAPRPGARSAAQGGPIQESRQEAPRDESPEARRRRVAELRRAR